MPSQPLRGERRRRSRAEFSELRSCVKVEVAALGSRPQ